MAERGSSNRYDFIHDGPFVTFARFSVLVVPAGAAVMFVIAAFGIFVERHDASVWFWVLMAVWGVALSVLGARQFRSLNRAASEVKGTPGSLTVERTTLVIECPALLEEPLSVEHLDVASIQTGRPPMGFSLNHGTRFTLSVRRPHVRIELVSALLIPQARNVPMAGSPYTLPSRRRRAPWLVFRFDNPEAATDALRRWLDRGGPTGANAPL